MIPGVGGGSSGGGLPPGLGQSPAFRNPASGTIPLVTRNGTSASPSLGAPPPGLAIAQAGAIGPQTGAGSGAGMGTAGGGAGAPMSREAQQRAAELNKIAKTQIAFKIGGLTEENYEYAQQEIQAVVRQNGGDTDLYFYQRLLHSSAAALGFQIPSSLLSNNSSSLGGGASTGQNTQSQLSFRLLASELKKLARDPSKAPRWTEAVSQGLASGSSTAEEHLGLAHLVARAGLTALETLILVAPLLALPSMGPGAAPTTPSNAPPGLVPAGVSPAQASKRKELAREAADLARSKFADAMLLLVQPAADERSMPTLPPMGLSVLLSRLVSDVLVPHAPNDPSNTSSADFLWTVADQRSAVQAVAQRVGVDLGSQIVSHCLAAADFLPPSHPASSSAVQLLFRLCPDSSLCTAELVRNVLKRGSRLATAAPGEVEQLAAVQLEELVDLATRHGTDLGVDAASWIRGVGEAAPGVKWSEVVREAYDRPLAEVAGGNGLPETWGLRFLGQVLGLAPGSLNHERERQASVGSSTGSTSTVNAGENSAAAVCGLFGKWRHPGVQLTLIDRLLYLPVDASPFLAALKPTPLGPMLPAPCHRIVSLEDAVNSSPTIRQLAKGTEGSSWNVKELMGTVVRALGRGAQATNREAGAQNGAVGQTVRDKAGEILERACNSNPDLVMMSLVQVERPWGAVHTDLAARLLQSFLMGHAGHQLVFLRIWQTDSTFLLAALRDFYEQDPMNVTRILDIAQDLKILEHLLDIGPVSMRLDIAALASRREYLNLEKWLVDQVAEKGQPFMLECLAFLNMKVRHDLSKQDQDPPSDVTTLSLSAPVVSTFLRALRLHAEALGPEDVESYKEIRTASIQLYPRLMSFTPGNDVEPGMSVNSFDAETENEVDGYYKRMYAEEISIDQVLHDLQRAKHSDQPHDLQFVACFLHGLFDEYKFFHGYPPKELELTASLFGSLINERLIGYVPLGIAVRYVLDAIKNDPQSNWYKFGVQALSRFQHRLPDWPALAAAVARVEHLQVTHPEIAAIARSVVTGAEDQDQALNGPEPSDLLNGATAVDERPAFTAIRVEGGCEEPSAPPESVSDAMLFIVNNLAPNNFEQKVPKMSATISEEYYAWFARYLVSQRVSIEPNNHTLYLQFLEALDLPAVMKRVLNETFLKCRSLLNAEKSVQSATERTVLKNLGAWLGALTLAKDRPIKHRNIAFKQLLEEGYDNGRLIVAIPFVCKVLEQASKSKVFKPPNPWLMAILALLVELYHCADLKLNLKFEIEVLCKALKVDLQSVQATTTLQDRLKEAASADAGTGIGAEHGAGAAGRTSAAEGRQPVQAISLGGQVGYMQSLQELIANALVELQRYIRFTPEVQLNNNVMWRKVVYAAIERAIRDIIAPVVERSVTIASISTRELTQKDFAMDGSEEKMRKAAHLMVQDLAGSLALVTTKEPLRSQIMSNIRSLSLQSGFPEQNVSEEEIQQVTHDNLELACQVIERVATEKAINEVDTALASAYESRRQHKERPPANGSQFWDTSAMAASHYSSMLPPQLRLKLGGLDTEQFRVYEDFGVIRDANAGYHGRSESPVAMDDPALAPALAVAKVATRSLSLPEVTERINGLVVEIERCTTDPQHTALAQFPEDHELHGLLSQIAPMLEDCVPQDQAFLICAQKVVASMYRSERPLTREIYIAVLDHICRLSPKVAHEVSQWVVYAEDDRKLVVPVTVALVTHGIVKLADLDNQYAKLIIRDYRQSVIEFVVEFVQACLLADSPIATFADLRSSLQALAHAVQSRRTTASVAVMVEDLKAKARASANEQDEGVRSRADEAVIRDRLAYCFQEWTRIYTVSYSVEQPFVDFIVTLQGQGILRGEDISSLFFRICIEMGVNDYIKAKATGTTPPGGVFQPIDAFAKLLSMMIKYHADPTGAENDKAKVHYISKILSIVTLVVAHTHEELGTHFQQKPFFRFFSSLLSHLNQMHAHLGTAYTPILIALANSINTLQPRAVPGFAASWMSLISHRLLMPKLLSGKDRDGWSVFHRLLLNLVRFLAPFLNEDKLDETANVLHSGTARILLVLLRDFPDFLAAYYHSLSDALPPHCIQLQQVILSAFPSGARLLDPFAPGIVLENHPDARVTPVIMTDFSASLQTFDVRAALEKALLQCSPESVVPLLKQAILSPGSPQIGARTAVNITLASSVVLFLGVVATSQAAKDTTSPVYNPTNPSAQIFKQLVAELEPEGRYYLLCSAVNQLRWPNVHTVWFSALLLDTFTDTGDALVREQITRVFLERLLVHRPYPFGVQYTFIRLLTLPNLNLLEQPFAQRSDEIKALLVNCSLKARKQPV